MSSKKGKKRATSLFTHTAARISTSISAPAVSVSTAHHPYPSTSSIDQPDDSFSQFVAGLPSAHEQKLREWSKKVSDLETELHDRDAEISSLRADTMEQDSLRQQSLQQDSTIRNQGNYIDELDAILADTEEMHRDKDATIFALREQLEAEQAGRFAAEKLAQDRHKGQLGMEESHRTEKKILQDDLKNLRSLHIHVKQELMSKVEETEKANASMKADIQKERKQQEELLRPQKEKHEQETSFKDKESRKSREFAEAQMSLRAASDKMLASSERSSMEGKHATDDEITRLQDALEKEESLRVAAEREALIAKKKFDEFKVKAADCDNYKEMKKLKERARKAEHELARTENRLGIAEAQNESHEEKEVELNRELE